MQYVSYSKLKFINLVKRSLYVIPVASNNLGYILILVKPGKVFISFIYILFVSFSTKKSTLDKPLPSIDLYAFIANFLISSDISTGRLAGIFVLDSWFLYLAS